MTRNLGPQDGGGRVGIVENWELRQGKGQEANSGAFKGLVFVGVALVLLVVGGWYAARPMVGPTVESVFADNPGIVGLPLISDLLAAEFADRINAPAGSGEDEIKFVIEPGQTMDEIGQNLVDEGLLTDPMAFEYAVMRDRVDQLIQPGTYTMTPRITPAGIAARFEGDPDPPTPNTSLDMRTARRIEQVVAYLQQQTEETDLGLDPREFLQLARNPTNRMRNQYAFLKQTPDDASLEGFLYPGTYEVPIDITSEELVHQMLQRWEERMSPYLAEARRKEIPFHDALVVASLVEREAMADSDRRKIAGVYWNRLDPQLARKAGTSGLLQADPTVVYATDSMALADIEVRDWDEYVFWDLLGLSDYSTVDVGRQYASYQTYREAGLPDGPIVTPSAASMEAALNPGTGAGNMFFYACPGSETHKFAKNANQHQRNIDNCS